MDVGEMRDARRHMSTLCDAVARGDHQVEAAEVEEPERRRHQGEQRPVPVGDARYPLERRGVDWAGLHVLPDAPWNVEEGEDLRTGKEPDQLREHQLSATAPGEPVMDESDAHHGGVRAASV